MKSQSEQNKEINVFFLRKEMTIPEKQKKMTVSRSEEIKILFSGTVSRLSA